MRFCFFYWFFRELLNLSRIFLVAFKLYTFGSWFHYNHWVEVLLLYTFGSHLNYKRWVEVFYQIWILAFLGLYSNIVVGSQRRIDWGSHQRGKWFPECRVLKGHGWDGTPWVQLLVNWFAHWAGRHSILAFGGCPLLFIELVVSFPYKNPSARLVLPSHVSLLACP